MEADLVLESLRSESAEPTPQVAAFLYEQLRGLAANQVRRERANHTLQPTALVNEAWLRIAQHRAVDPTTTTRFFAIAAATMRRVLIDHARRRRSDKRGGEWHRVTLDEGLSSTRGEPLDVLALEAALRKLQVRDPRAAQTVELRVFGGLGMAEIATLLRVTRRTAQSDWALAKAFLRRELANDQEQDPCETSTGTV